jgi:hypothetical protein
VTPATSDAHPGSFQLLLRHRRLDHLKQLVHIFSSNGLTRTVTSTVYGGTRGQVHSPAHDYAKFNNTLIITINYSSSGPRELWGFSPARGASAVTSPRYFKDSWKGQLSKYYTPMEKSVRALYDKQYSQLSNPVEEEDDNRDFLQST